MVLSLIQSVIRRTILNILSTVNKNLSLNNFAISYLLVKQCPEHGKRDVQEEDLQDHFDLSNEKFLETEAERERESLRFHVFPPLI